MVSVAATPPRVRRADPADRHAIEGLLDRAGLPTVDVAHALANPSNAFIVAHDPDTQNTTVAVAGLEVHGEFGLLRSVAVDAGWRHRGVGRTLVSQIIRHAQGIGIRRLYLLTTTAANYFHQIGFIELDRRAVPPEIAATAEFRDICPASATVMVYPLRWSRRA